MASAPQGLANVMGQGAHIGAAPALYFQYQLGWSEFNHLDVVDLHRAGLALHLYAGAGQFIEPLPIYLDGAVHRRRLLHQADPGPQALQNISLGQALAVAGLHHFALCVIGGGGDAQGHFHPVPLQAACDVVHQPGSLAEAHRKHAPGQRVHGAAVTDLLALSGDALDPAQGIHGGDARGLEQVDEAVDHRRPDVGLGFAHASRCPRRWVFQGRVLQEWVRPA